MSYPPPKEIPIKEGHKRCNLKTQIFSRVVGYYAVVDNFNLGKKEEFRNRKTYDMNLWNENFKKSQEKKKESFSNAAS